MVVDVQQSNESQPTFWVQMNRLFFSRVDIASLVYFRIVFGLIMLWEVWRFIQYDWITVTYDIPTFHFTYFGFEWVKPLNPDGWYNMHRHFVAMGVLTAAIALGLFYRISAFLFFLSFLYIFLIEKAKYLNHFYFIILIAFWLPFIPAHRSFSIDAWLSPKLRSQSAPAWSVWILRFLMGVVYFFGGIAKLNGDWLRGEPIRMWLANHDDDILIGSFVDQEWFVYLMAHGGMLFDLLVTFCLLSRRIRPYAFGVVLFFHLTNSWVFSIGVFPWLSIGATLMFFSPDWPRRWVSWISRGRISSVSPVTDVDSHPPRMGSYEKGLVVLILVFATIQVLMPLRHFVYPGNVSWTEEGHNFAWHMKLRQKRSDIEFAIRYPDGFLERIDEEMLEQMLTDRQLTKMSTRPDMIVEFAHHLRDLGKQAGHDVQVYALVFCSLNGREPQLLIDPSVDLSAVEISIRPASYIVPLTTPLRSEDTTQ